MELCYLLLSFSYPILPLLPTLSKPILCRFSCLTPGLDWTRLFMSLTAGAGTRCMSLLPDSPTLEGRDEHLAQRSDNE